MSYRYRHGESPLDGYTVLRGLGRGGFGEVYYARSDSGREVALKVIQQNADIELRGVREFVRTNGHMVIAILLFTPAVVCLLPARRWAGPMHVLRGAAGWATAAVLVSDVASSISQKIAHDTFSTPFLRLLVLGILSAVFLAWPGTAIQTHGRPSRTHDNSAGTGGAGQATRS